MAKALAPAATDPHHRDNVGLRLAMTSRTPLINFFGVLKGQYMPVWPAFVVGDDPPNLYFKVAMDDHRMEAEPDSIPSPQSPSTGSGNSSPAGNAGEGLFRGRGSEVRKEGKEAEGSERRMVAPGLGPGASCM